MRNRPDKRGINGVIQPMLDGLKLIKKDFNEFQSNTGLGVGMLVSTSVILALSVVIWLSFSLKKSINCLAFLRVLVFLCIMSVLVYPTLAATSRCNSKYPLISLSRAVSQAVSYEINLTLTFFFFFLIKETFNFDFFDYYRRFFSSYYLLPVVLGPIGFIFLVRFIAERSRTPFDFRERERELVSGVSSEFGTLGFIFIFLAEYSRLLIISFIFSVIWARFRFQAMVAVIYIVIHTRSAYPRVRYDYIMIICWESLFPGLGAMVLVARQF